MLKCKHQCHCTCISGIETCKINDAERQAVLKVYINFKHKKTTNKLFTKINDIIL